MIVIYVRNGSIILSIYIDNSFIGELNEELLSKKDKATQNVLEKEKNRLIHKIYDLKIMINDWQFSAGHFILSLQKPVNML